MDRRLLNHYERELRHLYQVGTEFAHEFPTMAQRLALDQFKCSDPYVERLLQGFAFLAARVQLKLEAEFPRFTQGLLETVYPHYLAPTPSMAIVQLEIDHAEPGLKEGVIVKRETGLTGILGRGETTRCQYRTCHEVTLYPLKVLKAEYHTRTLDTLGPPGGAGAKAAIRIQLGATAGLKIKDIPADRLVLHLHSDGPTGGRLYEQMLAQTTAVCVQPVRTPLTWREVQLVSPNTAGSASSCVRRVGYGEHEALLPVSPRSFQGYRLVHEYFALPERFLFVELAGLRKGLARCDDDKVDIVIFLRQGDANLENAVSEANIRLFCTPAINLFPKRTDRVRVEDRFREFHVVADVTKPLDYEVYQVKSVQGFAEGSSPVTEFRPFYAAVDDSYLAEPGRAYFAVSRIPRTLSQKEQQQGPRTSYAGSEVYVSLVDASSAPYRADLKTLGVEALCTNRDLPIRMPVGRGQTDFTLDTGAPVQAIRILGAPTPPRPSYAEGETAWRIISHLSLNYLSVADAYGADAQPGSAGTAPGAALRDILRLYGEQNEPATKKQIEGVKNVQSKAIIRRVEGPGPISFARGLEVSVQLEEMAFEGHGPFLLGSVLDHFFAKYVSLNSFTETVVRSSERGEIMRWPARIGRRHLV